MSDILNHELVRRVGDRLRVTRVVCSRTVKGQGDTYLGMATDTTQEEAGMTLQEAQIAGALLGLHVDVMTYQQAAAGGVVTPEQRDVAIATIRANYARLLAGLVHLDGGKGV